MKDVMRWLEEYALASYGLDAEEQSDATKRNIEEVGQLFGAKLGEDGLTRINALRTLGAKVTEWT